MILGMTEGVDIKTIIMGNIAKSFSGTIFDVINSQTKFGSSYKAFITLFHLLPLSQVDENGKITRLRRECPSESCGAGVFMAQHFDRQYCGRCSLTYVFNKPGEGSA